MIVSSAIVSSENPLQRYVRLSIHKFGESFHARCDSHEPGGELEKFPGILLIYPAGNVVFFFLNPTNFFLLRKNLCFAKSSPPYAHFPLILHVYMPINASPENASRIGYRRQHGLAYGYSMLNSRLSSAPFAQVKLRATETVSMSFDVEYIARHFPRATASTKTSFCSSS